MSTLTICILVFLSTALVSVVLLTAGAYVFDRRTRSQSSARAMARAKLDTLR